MPQGYPFIHPLLTHDDSCAGYLVEYAAGASRPETLQGIIQFPQFSRFDKRHPWFIPNDGLEGKYPEQIVPCFSSTAPASDERTEQEAELRKLKRKIALEIAPNSKLPAAGTWDYALISAGQARILPPFSLQGLSSRTTIVATGIQNHSDRSWIKLNACSLCTTEFLLTRSANEGKADTTRRKMLELLALIAQDADTEALNEIFRQEPKLSYSLLRLVNSAAIAPRTQIASFSQAINLLGRRPLERWLQLLIYADPDDGQHPNPLLYKAAVRGRLMEQLAPRLQPPPDLPNLPDNAFMIGCFSLLDILLGIPMPEILLQLPISETAIEALAHHAGNIGKLLQALEVSDARSLTTADRLLDELGIDKHDFLQAQLEALSWASRIRQAA